MLRLMLFGKITMNTTQGLHINDQNLKIKTMKKEILIPAIIVLAIILLSFIIFISTGDSGVNGMDAFALAAKRGGYWLWIVGVIAAGIATILFAKRQDVTGIGINFIAAAIVAALCLAIFLFPASIKTDPISSGITTEEINTLRANQLK